MPLNWIPDKWRFFQAPIKSIQEMQEGCCTSFWGHFCFFPLSYSCFLCLSKPLPSCSSLLLFPPCHSIPAFPGRVFSFLQQFPFWPPIWSPSTSLLCLDPPLWVPISVTHFPSLAIALFTLSSSLSISLSSIFHLALHLSNKIHFSSRPWKDFFRGISSLMWAVCQMRLWHFIFRAIKKTHPLPKWSLSSSDTDGTCLHPSFSMCVERKLSSNQFIWPPSNHYDTGNGPLGGTHWNFRAFYCLGALAAVCIWSSVVELCFCHSFNKYKNNH